MLARPRESQGTLLPKVAQDMVRGLGVISRFPESLYA